MADPSGGAVVRDLLSAVAAACVAGLTASASLIATNGALRDLILHTQGGWLAGVLLAIGFATTFGGAAVGLAFHRIDTCSADRRRTG